MSNRETDISQIRKYLNGELDAKAMHQLERRAQSDPFLMDALEGYGYAQGSQYARLDEISKRLRQRITAKERRIIPWKYMAIAASVLVVLTFGVVFFQNNRSVTKQQRVANVVKYDGKATSDTVANRLAEQQKPIAAPTAAAPANQLRKLSPNNNAGVTQAPPVAKDIAATKPSRAVNIRADTVADREVSSSVAAVTPADELATADKKQEDKALQGHAAGAIVDNHTREARTKQLKNVVIGRVIETDHGLPVAGATVRVEGSNVTAHTNNSGYFTIPADTSKDKLYIANLGYVSRQVGTKNKDSLKKIKLEPDNNSLNEVVVTQYKSNKNADDETATESGAHPGNGWGDFNKYLKKNAVSPDGSAGVVKLSFTVAADGAVSNITVTKSLSKAADQKAIDLVKNGTAWVGNTNGQPEKVTVRIKFVKAK